jgi:hypothetical protein
MPGTDKCPALFPAIQAIMDWSLVEVLLLKVTGFDVQNSLALQTQYRNILVTNEDEWGTTLSE